MSKIPENPVYEDTVYQIDTSDPLKGGVAVFDGDGEASNGFLNAGVQQVTNRTAYLKVTLDSHVGSGGAAHSVVTNASNGFMSAADKTKLDGITAGAQPNTVTSVAGRTGVVTLTSSDVGLGNVNNTADSAKPVSTAQQTALNLKANLASPTLTGTPLAPTATAGTNTTQIATTAFVTAAVGGVTSPVTSVAGRTGAVVLTSSDVGLGNVNNTSDANKPVSTAQQSALDLKANSTNAILFGTPSAPTAAVGTNNNQIATTAFVLANSSTSSQNFLQVQDQKALGTNAGGAVTGTTVTSFTRRSLNTSVINQISGASLAGDIITLPIGTYYLECFSILGTNSGAQSAKFQIWNESISAQLLESLQHKNTGAPDGNIILPLSGMFTLSASQGISLRYNIGLGGGTTSLGAAANKGSAEIYSDVRIWKLS